MNIDADIDAEDLIKMFADLKGIPVSKVIRNAARDFVKVAYRSTPVASTGKSRFYRLELPGGKIRYIHDDQLAGRKRNKSFKRHFTKVRIAKGWSRASWIGVFKALEIPGKGPARAKSLSKKVERISKAKASGNDTNARIDIIDDIRFTSRKGVDYQIVDAGMAAAAKNIVRNFVKMLRDVQGGKQPRTTEP